MDSITFFHLNDVYNADRSAKFVSKWRQSQLEEENMGRSCLSFFSGDAWSPSIMTTIVRGKQMVPVLNAMKLDAACLGNHDLDLGLTEFSILRDQTNFPWVCSNVRHIPSDNKPLGGCHEYVVVEGKYAKGTTAKLLVLGLVEGEWIDTLSTIDPRDVAFEDFCAYVKRRVPELVAVHEVDGVIAMSHMRMPNDYRLAEECGGFIDIILGGHDHHYEDSTVNDVRVLNSGTDFSDFSVIQILGREDGASRLRKSDESLVFPYPLKTSCRRVKVDQSSGEGDPEIVAALKDIQQLVDSTMDKQIGSTKVDLDARFQEIRTKETNISNLVANLMTRATGADVAILNSGTLRADAIIPKGPLLVRDLYNLLPMADPLEVIEIDGSKLVQALENGVSKYPAMEGRFPCVDGVRFQFAPSRPAGSRVVEGSVTVFDKKAQQFELLDPNKKYTVVSKSYLTKGKDGYDSFVGARVVLDDEECPTLPTLLRNLFTEISVLKKWEGCTVQGTVVSAATKFKRLIRRSVADPYAISPIVDGRITNVEVDIPPA